MAKPVIEVYTFGSILIFFSLNVLKCLSFKPLFMPELVLVKSTGEISIKSDYVRRQFSQRLLSNIKASLKQNSINTENAKTLPGRIFLKTSNNKNALKTLSKVFGIHSFALAEEFAFEGFGQLCEEILKYCQKLVSEKDSFALRVSRNGIHDFSSQDVAVKAGDLARKATKAKVDLSNPKKEIFAEIYQDFFCIYSLEEKGLNGLPVGVSGNIALVLEGKKEEFDAGYSMLKRGCSVFGFVYKKSLNSKAILKNLKPYNCFREIPLLSSIPKNCSAVVKADTVLNFEKFKEFDSLNEKMVLRPLLLRQ